MPAMLLCLLLCLLNLAAVVPTLVVVVLILGKYLIKCIKTSLCVSCVGWNDIKNVTMGARPGSSITNTL